MRVSRSLIWILALLAALSFAISPVFAGDHPWNEDENGSSAGDSGEPGNGDLPPDDPTVTPPDTFDELYGTPLFWWDIVLGQLMTGGGSTTSTAEPAVPNSGNSSQAGEHTR